MNIVFLLRLWPIYGGGETVTICLANEMAKRGHAVTVFYFKDSETNELPYIDPSIKAVKIPDVRCDEYTYDSDDGIAEKRHASKLISNKNLLSHYEYKEPYDEQKLFSL